MLAWWVDEYGEFVRPVEPSDDLVQAGVSALADRDGYSDEHPPPAVVREQYEEQARTVLEAALKSSAHTV